MNKKQKAKLKKENPLSYVLDVPCSEMDGDDIKAFIAVGFIVFVALWFVLSVYMQIGVFK
jgi:hypothetical protein